MILRPFQSTSIEMISTDTMKEDSLNDYKDLNWTPSSKEEFNYACAFVYLEHGS